MTDSQDPEAGSVRRRVDVPSKATGALLGLALGDALGAPFEGRLRADADEVDALISAGGGARPEARPTRSNGLAPPVTAGHPVSTMQNLRWLVIGGLLAVVAGVLLIPTLSLLFVLILRIAPLALLVAALVGAAYLLTRRRHDDGDDGADPDDRGGARPISTGEGFVVVPDYPEELPWWDERDGSEDR